MRFSSLISWLQKVLHSLAVLVDKNRARALSKRWNYEKDMQHYHFYMLIYSLFIIFNWLTMTPSLPPSGVRLSQTHTLDEMAQCVRFLADGWGSANFLKIFAIQTFFGPHSLYSELFWVHSTIH